MNAKNGDDDVLRAYLLGSLAPESRESVEKRVFSDDRIFWERLCLVEEELIDDYARGVLDNEESLSFERHFLCTSERRAKLELARALEAHAARQQTVRRRARSHSGIGTATRGEGHPLTTVAGRLARQAVGLPPGSAGRLGRTPFIRGR